MLPNAGAVGAGNNSHATVLALAIVDSVPRGNRFGRFESSVGHILVPCHKLILIGTIFAKEVRPQHHDIGAY